MPHVNGPMDPRAFHELVTWLFHRSGGEEPALDPLTNYLPQGVLAHPAIPCLDPEDKSPMIALTTQSIRPEKLRIAERETAEPAAPRTRLWDPEAVLIIRLALVNGGTMFVDDDGGEGNAGKGWHYPRIYGRSLYLHRIFCDAQPGQRVKQHENQRGVTGHRDCRMRWLSVEPGNSRDKNGRAEFLEIAGQTYAKTNLLDGLTGPERFGFTEAQYLRLLEDALNIHRVWNNRDMRVPGPEAPTPPKALQH